MKKTYLVITALLIVISSCKKDEFNHQSEFENSYRTWVNYKSSVGNNYVYTAATSSFSGITTETTITVLNGKVTSRSYTATRTNVSPAQTVESWTENATALSTHTSGAAAITLDDIYAKAKSEWLAVDAAKNDIYFDTANNGMISNCGYAPKNCADDCFTGITIKSISGVVI